MSQTMYLKNLKLVREKTLKMDKRINLIKMIPTKLILSLIHIYLQQRDSLEVNKTLGSTTPYTDNNFEFQLLKQNQNGQYEPVGNKAYTLYTANNSIESNNYKTDKNGKFYLKAGQRVNFTSNQIGKYKVVELTGGYEKTWSGRKESIATGNISDNKNAYEIQISENDTKTATRYTVNCINSADCLLYTSRCV